MNKLQEKLDNIVELYEQAIELAREEEREACAKVCDSAAWGIDVVPATLALAIRARGEVK